MTFTDLLLPPDLIAGLAKEQIRDPTPIQSAGVPVLLVGKDACLNAETGTGKTLAYLLPLFARIDPAQAATQVVVVAPTHELAIQIHRDLAQNAGRAIRSVLLIGGTATARQIEKLKGKPQVASDLAARGLNIPGVTHIFNLDVPTMSNAYLHRVGRTGRAGAQGTAISLVTEIEARLVRRYERELGIVMQCVRIRDGHVSECRR